MFSNEFLDSFQTDPDNYLKDLRRFGVGADREQIAQLIDFNPHTIRRFESKANKSKVPAWYPLLLRFLAGDLSYFGPNWQNARIHPTDRKLQSPHFPHTRLTPGELNVNHNTISRMAQKELRTMQQQLNKLETQVNVLKTRNAELELDKEKLQMQIDQLKAKEKGIKSGKVVNLFGS